jgi:hypothetical protein
MASATLSISAFTTLTSPEITTFSGALSARYLQASKSISQEPKGNHYKSLKIFKKLYNWRKCSHNKYWDGVEQNKIGKFFIFASKFFIEGFYLCVIFNKI